jgi:hypothetical protein
MLATTGEKVCKSIVLCGIEKKKEMLEEKRRSTETRCWLIIAQWLDSNRKAERNETNVHVRELKKLTSWDKSNIKMSREAGCRSPYSNAVA